MISGGAMEKVVVGGGVCVAPPCFKFSVNFSFFKKCNIIC